MYDPDMILALSRQRRRELEAEAAERSRAHSIRRARPSRPSLGASASAALRRFRSAFRVPAKQVTVKQA